MPISFVSDIFAVIRATPVHTFQVLTKRSERAVRCADRLDWAPNLWMRVSVENQNYARRSTSCAASRPPYGSYPANRCSAGA